MSSLTELKAAKDRIGDLRKQAVLEAQAVLAPTLKAFLKEHTDIKTIMWTQYTPYWMDGQQCEFYVNEIIFSTVKHQQYVNEDMIEDAEESVAAAVFTAWGANPILDVSIESWKDCETLTSLLGKMDDELLAAFGDHVSVVVNEDGIIVEGWEHS